MTTAVLLRSFDIMIMATALLASWLWLQASRQRLRRLSRHEDLDAADMNRIVVAINRTQILNARAALASALAAALTGVRFALDALSN
ncbi:hypothetical protein [uncultured Alsobacter sp.]|uniref:hypothetical protein n=1 Tax=uncultured Alsobacter sp. TaxID=1748258 RepID=UPI0025FB19C9|nr:hypothetical protein [uncultured Alsobacter sp.]